MDVKGLDFHIADAPAAFKVIVFGDPLVFFNMTSRVLSLSRRPAVNCILGKFPDPEDEQIIAN